MNVEERRDKNMSALLNAVPGTIVYFSENRVRKAATLVPGGIEDGVLQDLRWTDSYGSEWTLAELEAGGPVVDARYIGFDLTHPTPGMIVTFDNPHGKGFRMVATRTPGALGHVVEFTDVNWVDSYNTHFTNTEIMANNPEVYGTVIAQPTNIPELMVLLRQYIRDEVYTVHGVPSLGWTDEACYLDVTDGRWSTYYLERGSPHTIHEFDSEADACSHFWDWMQEGSYNLKPAEL